MSFKISKILQFPQSTLQYIPQVESNINLTRGLPLLGGVLSDTRYVWHAKGPCLEVRNTKTGIKVGAWTFGCILKDSNTKVVCVEEIQRVNGLLSLLAIGIDCTISGGLICIFDVFGSKVIRAIQIKEKITSLHVVDSGCEVLNLPGPLRNFDGIIAVGTEGGNVFLVDICRQICEEALYITTVRDELYPCQLILLTSKDISNIEYYKEQSVREGDHLAIHLNVVLHSQTEHFTLKGPKGEDRIHVNREEVVTSALYYCSQLTSLLIGFNFGAFQLWDLTRLKLVYTSPVCEEHSPITHFALQEPADDPRAFCYIWVSYSNSELYQTGLPFAVMYSVCYDSKEFHEGYGYLYQDFQSCSVRFQVELGQLEERKPGSKPRGGCCIGLQPVCKLPANKDLYSHDNTGDTLALCAISWTVWFNQNETQSYLLVFDLNQWYKEQMPHITKGSDCSTYILKAGISELITMSGNKGSPLLDMKIDKKTLRQFSGVQRLEEHFCPTALSFDLWVLKETDIVLLHNEGLQQALLNQIEAAGPLCLIRPNDIYRQIVMLGLVPLFSDISMNIPVSTDIQREIILNVGLEHRLVGWLCKCASEWANGSFSSAGCSLDFLMHWGFQRAILLKNNCDRYCMPLFDYSQSRLDNNTSILLNNCTRQINNLCTLYSYVIHKLTDFVSNLELIVEQHTSLKMVSMYFEVLQWLVNVGLLPECHPSTYPRPDNTERISAPYPVQELTEYYNEKRAQLQMLSRETFVSSDSLLFIDNLINNKCGAEQLQKQWQDDGGSGLYPPPSLQSMLRTYLIEGADISQKHSLVIYVFLDLAMALDQSRYASVITHLIKFPAVFKVSSSVIKITQAFWQLDHGDYTTAMEQLLDPFVLSDDLQPRHHAIAMRALLLQNQYNFALLYMQVRKPPITDEKDVLTAISLFIANNMLDEAFYFKNQHHNNNNEERLLMHLFNECNKNESLHSLLYRCLDTNEEKAFFKYLKSVGSPSSDDLQVFYFLMRSRFVEAFDAHDNSKRKKPECQGLIGQRNATRADQIVRIFKTLLPDVNRNLVDVVQRERTNLWKEVARPTPLSVFVHNTNEQIKYKSTVIQAALAKAKHTFNDSMNNSKFKEVLTEETPFLRTPKASRTSSRHVTPVITPKMIDINEFGEEMVPSPCKKLKLTPRTSTTSPTWNRSISIHSKMLTPIVKRKTSLRKDESLSTSNINVCTPQSILKVRNLVRHSDTIPDDSNVSDMLEDSEGAARTEISTRKSGLGLLPRKSLSRTTHRPHVQFDDAARFSSSFSEQSVKSSHNNTTLGDQSLDKSTLSSKDISVMVSSKNSSTSNTDDVFYSPNTSINELSKSEEEDNSISTQSHSQNEEVAIEVIADKNEKKISEDTPNIPQSPRARRSYKRSLGESLPIRSSSRITRNSSVQYEKSGLDVPKDTAVSITPLESPEKLETATSKEESALSSVELSQTESSALYQSPRILQKVKGRKSLNRQVLEHNTLSRMKSEDAIYEVSISKTEKTIITEKTLNSSDITTIETKRVISNASTPKPGSHNLHSSSSSVFKKKVSELRLDSDTSVDSNISLDSPELPESLKVPDYLVEYMKSRTRKNDNDEIVFEVNKTQVEKSENRNVHVEESRKIPKTVEGAKLCPEPIKVYEDLSSGAEDIEVSSASRRQMDNYKLYGEFSYNSAGSSDRFEENFDNSETQDQSLEEAKGSANETAPGCINISETTSDSSLQNKSSSTVSYNVSQDQSDDGSSKISSPSVNECTKLLQRVQGRKSLSRQVLEHNTISRMMASTPHSNDALSKEASGCKMEKSFNTSESETPDSYYDRNTSLVTGHLDTDTSVDSDILECPELPDSLKISDSLIEYMKSRSTKRDNVDESVSGSNISQTDKSEIIQGHSEDQPAKDRSNTTLVTGHLDIDTSVESDILECPELPDSLKISDSLIEYMKSRSTKRDNVNENVSDGNISQRDKSEIMRVHSEDQPTTSDEAKHEPESMEIYEEVLMASEQQIGNSKVYAQLSNCSENAYDELENNIFERTECRVSAFVEDIAQENVLNVSGLNSPISDSFDVPEAEKAFISTPSRLETSVLSAESYLSEAEKGFIADDQTLNLSKQQTEVIEISSSSDEEESSKSQRSDTSDSRSSEKSDSDADGLNISYERNIHVEENSQSLVDSELSAASVDRLDEPNIDEDNHANERENRANLSGDSNGESELEINEDNSSVEWMNNDQESGDENEQKPVPEVAKIEILKGVYEIEKEKPHEVIELEPEKLVQIETTIEFEIPVALVQREKIEADDETKENKDTSEINKGTSVMHTDEDKTEEKIETDDETKENKDTSEINKDTAVIHMDGDKTGGLQEKGKDIDQTVKLHSDEKISLYVLDEKNHAKNQREKEAITKVVQKEISEENKTHTADELQMEEDCIKEFPSLHSDKPDPKSIEVDEKGDRAVDYFGQNEQLQKETKEQQTNTSSTVVEDKTTSISGEEIEKKNQATNTTIISDRAKIVELKQLTVRIEQATNTTINDSTKEITPGRRTRRSQSVSTIIGSIKTRRSSIFDKPEESEPSTSEPKKELSIPLKRTRSASVDEVRPLSRKRSLRSCSSIDEKIEENIQDHKPKSKGKAASVSQMSVISEESNEPSKAGRRRKSSSNVEAYATSRRLTRRQSNLVKGIQTPSSITAQDDSDVDKSLEIDVIDPIVLLDKEPFQGKPDPEEEKVYQPSSPSNSTTSSFNKPMKRASRSASVASDSSLPPSASQPSTPKRRTRQSIGHVDSPSPSGVKTRLRRHSETSSLVSEKSDPPTPKRVRMREISKDTDENSDVSVAMSTRSTRSRANSSSSIKSDINSPSRATRSRRTVSAKSDLPEIMEEKVNETENASEKSAPKRQTRKKGGQ